MAEFGQEFEQVSDGVEEEVSAETVPSTANAGAATGQPEKQLNLDELPQFRKFKSEQDKRFAEQEKRYQAQLAQANAQAQQIRQQFEQQFVGNMDDDQKAAYLVQQAEQRAQAAEQRLYAIQVEDSKRNALQGIATKAGVPVEVLMAAESPDQAWELAWDYTQQRKEEAANESVEAKAKREQKRAANRPDLGNGAAVPIPTERDKLWETARKSKDTKSLFTLGLQSQ